MLSQVLWSRGSTAREATHGTKKPCELQPEGSPGDAATSLPAAVKAQQQQQQQQWTGAPPRNLKDGLHRACPSLTVRDKKAPLSDLEQELTLEA